MSDTVRDLVTRLAAESADGGWPDPALLQAILDQGEQAIEPLLELVERDADEDHEGAVYFAAPLLALLGTPRAVAPVVALLRRDDEDLTEWLCTRPSALQALGPDAIPPLLDITRDRSLGWFTRAMASEAARSLAGDDPALRATVGGALRALLAEYVARAEHGAGDADVDDEEADVVGSLVCDLAELADPGARPLIDAAFAKGIVNELFIGPEDVDELYREGNETTPPESPDDWLDWYAGRRDEALREEQRRHARETAPPLLSDFREMPVRVPPRPGRNDPCWCGSGKKYKKCHLVQDQS